MLKDPFFKAIWEGLDGKLDPDVFESCAIDLLSDVFPSIVPITGGNDAGLDGAVVTTDGPPIPVVCTTAQSAVRNLEKNLKSYLDERGKRREVLFATSRMLTPLKKRNLERKAENLGFTLLGVYDKEALSHRLYKTPRWCRELLHITGNPPALSLFARSTRTQEDIPLIGRDANLEWMNGLVSERKDFLISGQPGCGKTALLAKLREVNGRFAVDGNRQNLANAIREYAPNIIMVEDAHLREDLVNDLLHLRDELGHSFILAVDTWPTRVDNLKTQLRLSDQQVCELKLLTKDQMVEVVVQSGIVRTRHNDRLIAIIVRQAEGKPGLASTLTKLCLQGDIQSVTYGEALNRLLLGSIERGSGKRSAEILSAFALGGDRGIEMRTVATAFGIDLLTVRRILVDLEAAGVLRDFGQTLAVRPPAFRYVLIRDIFFSDGKSLPFNDFEPLVHSKIDLADGLIGAKHRQAKISDDLLFRIVSEANDKDTWGSYAMLGRRETLRALNAPEFDVDAIRDGGFSYAPDEFLPRMFEKAVGDRRTLHNNPDHALRRIGDWIKEKADTHEDQEKRERLLSSITNWVANGGDIEILDELLPQVTILGWEGNQSDPGSGMTFYLEWGLIPESYLGHIEPILDRTIDLIEKYNLGAHLLVSVVSNLVDLNRGRVTTPDSFKAKIRNIIDSRVERILAICKDDPGAGYRLRGVFNAAKIVRKIEIDPEFEVLYPKERLRKDYKAVEAEQVSKVDKLALSWKSIDPALAAKKIAFLTNSASKAEINYPDYSRYFCSKLSQLVAQPGLWLDEFIRSDIKSALIGPFLQEIVNRQVNGWEETLLNCFEIKNYQFVVIEVALSISSPSDRVKTFLNNELNENHRLIVEVLSIRQQLSLEMQELILKHRNRTVAGGLAVYMWEGRSKRPIEPSLYEFWQNAILDYSGDEHWTFELLSREKHLAKEWIKRRLANGENIDYSEMELTEKAASQVADEDKAELLRIIPNHRRYRRLVRKLVGGNVGLYEQLLKDQTKASLHLEPLKFPVGDQWIRLVLKAAEFGYSPEDMADAAFRHEGVWSGKPSGRWRGMLEAFAEYENHENPIVRRVIGLMKQIAESSLRRDLKWEEEEAIYGR